jgi:hypothetical protein
MKNNCCCEEMNEFISAFNMSKECVKDTKIFLKDDGMVEELAVGLNLDNVYIPNIIFRFCPFCGTNVQSDMVDIKDNTPQGKLASVVFNAELDDQNMSSTCKVALLHDAITQVRSILKTSKFSDIPATGFIKRS